MRYGLVIYMVLWCFVVNICAQTNFKDKAEKAQYYMEHSLQKFSGKSKYAIVFESVAYQLKNPTDIFRLPQYQLFKGGYVYMDGERYEYNIGTIKTLSDAKLIVYIDEINKQMLIDSVRNKGISEEQKQKNFVDFFEKDNGEFTYEYQKIDTLAGKAYHKIKCVMTKNKDVQLFYWIDVKTENMYMYAEGNLGVYDVYVIQKITTPPASHKYSIYLPNKELTSWHGYEVVDNRFVPMYGKEFQQKTIKELNK